MPSAATKPRQRRPPTATCPRCSSTATQVIETRLRFDGTRRRRHECKACFHRWTWIEAPITLRRGGNPAKRGYPVTADEIALILTSPLSNNQLARQLQLDAATIRKIRVGKIHARIHPELPRGAISAAPALSCQDCQHWRGNRCHFGFPDPIDEGPSFAADCDLYARPSLN